ncbi:DMT family transporter [Sphingobacterium rhinopitheci]|uniref:DMT family transporter n=1 Tax=Sphingobacterium rhinopitheci TaxID=2781960 RepID=UPI001F5279F5|nr:EamA family transporter [Sphingobacterium rhinopitheci]MCI0921349.1 EamA family transporter [Sphingobacterium rhinopitheci]
MTQENNPSIARIIFAYLVVYIVWGSTFFFIEMALDSFPTFVLGSVRFIIAGFLLMAYCGLKGYKIFNRKDIKQAVFIGFLLLFIDMAAIIWSEQYISSGIVSILSAATAIWFIILDKPKWKENFSSLPTVLGLLLGFTGVVLLFGEQIMTPGDEEGKTQRIIAMAVLTVGTIGWTIGSLASKYNKSPKSSTQNNKKVEPLNVIVKTAWQMITAGFAFSITAVATGQYSTFDFNSVLPRDWAAMTYLILMGSILAFSSYIWLLQVRPATEVSTYAYVNPIVALLLVHFFTDHGVTGLQIIGLVIVLFSVLLMNWNLYKNNRTIRALRYRKKLKNLKNMAPRSSIPRIIEVADFESKAQKKREDKEIKNNSKKGEI